MQNLLWANQALLRSEGVHYCPRFIRANNIDPLNIAVSNVKKAHLKNAAITAGRARLEALFSEMDINTVVLSNESALGDPFNDNKEGFFPFRKEALAGLKQMFEGYALVPVFFIRGQATLLPSFYGQRVRQGASYSFETFSVRMQACDLSWRPIVSDIKKAFGGVDFELHRFEEFAEGPEAFSSALFSRLIFGSSSGTKLATGNAYMKNAGVAPRGLAAMRSVSKQIEKLSGVSEGTKTKLKKRLRRVLFPALEYLPGGTADKFDDVQLGKLQKLYQVDVEHLFADHSPSP